MNRAIKYLFSFRCVALLCALFFMQQSSAQTVPVYGDSTRLSKLKNGAGNELIIENSTKNIAGALVNYANGRTHFVVVIDTSWALNDSTTRYHRTNGGTYDITKHSTGSVTSSVAWGSITGTLSAQTDLQAALNAKFNNPTGTTLQYIRGDGSLSTFPTNVSTFTNDAGYITGNQSITWTGSNDVTGTATGTTSLTPSLTVNWANGYPTYDLRYASLLNSDFIASGGIVTWISGYTYNVSPAVYYINGVRYTSPSTNITLSAADATFDRIDVFALTTSGTAVAITGTPTSNPEKPDIDNNTQIEASFAVVEHATTQPTINQEWIYRENADWTTAVSNASMNPNSTNSPFAGSKDVEGTAVANTHNITYTRGTALNISTFSNAVLSFEIKSKASWSTNKKFVLQWFNGTTAVGNAIPFGDQSYGFVSSSTSSYFLVSIPLKDFGALSTVTRLRMQAANTTGTFGFFIDNIQIQSVTQTGTTETDPIANAKTITENDGYGLIEISTATQSLVNNPSWTRRIDTFAIETRARGLKLIDSLKSVADANYVPLTRTITINGTTQDLSANRTWTLTTDNIAEGSTNKYYTDARARAALSLTTTGTGAATYNNSTGVLNVPTPSGSGGISTATLPLIISGSNVSRRYNVLDYGAVGDGVTNDAPAIQNAINAAFNAGGTAEVFFPYTGNSYIIASALSTSDSCQLCIPFSSITGTGADTAHSITLRGESPPNDYTDWGLAGTHLMKKGAVVLESTSTKQLGSVLGSIVGSTNAGNFTQTTLENLCIRVRAKNGFSQVAAAMTAFDASGIEMVGIHHCRFDTQSPQDSSVQPLATAYGIKCPSINNWAHIDIQDLLIQGFYVGMQASEHTDADMLNIATCYDGITFAAGFHTAHFNRAALMWNVNHILLSATAHFKFDNLDLEDYNPPSNPTVEPAQWFNTVTDLKDSLGSSTGELYYQRTIAGVSINNTLLTSTTNANIIYTPIGTAWTKFTTQVTLNPASTVTQGLVGTNSFNGAWEQVMQNNSTGTVATATYTAKNSAGAAAQMSKLSTGYSGYKIFTASDMGFYNSSGGNMSFLTEAGEVRFASNGHSTNDLKILTTGALAQPGTNTAAGTTGAQTINKPTGVVNFAAGASTLVVTNSLATTTSVVMVTVYGTDATATTARVTRASGSFTITLNAAATAETAVGFWVINNF